MHFTAGSSPDVLSAKFPLERLFLRKTSFVLVQV